MGKRGRKSSADLSVVPRQATAAPAGRPSPPDDLTAEQAAEWRAIVGGLPAEWFGREQLPLLAAYCRHTCRYRTLSRHLDALDPVGDPKGYDALARTAERESRAMLAHARALRLTLQARADPGTAGRKTRNRPSTYELME